MQKSIVVAMAIILFCGVMSSAGAADSNYRITEPKVTTGYIELGALIDQIEETSDYTFLYSNSDIDESMKVVVNTTSRNIFDILDSALTGAKITYEVKNRVIALSKKSVNDQQPLPVTVTGKVKDANGRPLIGVSVTVKGSAVGQTTDLDGNFSLNVPGGGNTLVFSFLGFKPREIEIGSQRSFDVTMYEDTRILDETVVIGYGTVLKSDLTGSVASVSENRFKDQPVKRIEDILQGRASGVEVTNLSGVPGEAVKVRVRGTTSINKSSDPLYVIDGIVSSSGLEGINPADIQSIEILKDASSTAIYGSRGANGVILVTTKGGSEGRTQVSFESSVGISNMAKKYDLLSAYDYALALNDIRGSATISAADLEAYRDGTKGIDWVDLMTQTGVSQDYKLSISGGNAKNRYLVSGNVLDQSAITITTTFKRYNLRFNYDSEVNDWLNLAVRFNASKVESHNNDIDMKLIINYSPTMEMQDADGVYNNDPYNAINANPYGDKMVNYTDNERYYANGNTTLLFKIADGLTLSVQGGYNYYHDLYYAFVSKLSSPGQINGATNRSTLYEYWQNTNNLTYQKTFGDHRLTAMAVWEISKNTTKLLSVSSTNLSNESVGYWNLSNASNHTPGNGYSEESIASGIARVMYYYKGRYMFTGTFRADASSKFAAGNRWGYFPSFAVAWDVADEKFMKDQSLFQQLKLRTSYGITGNQGIDSYSTLAMVTETAYGWGTSNNYTGYWANTTPSRDIRWERTHQYDIGLDAAVLNNRMAFSFDWFIKNSKDLLFQKGIPMYNGGGTYWVNQGEIRNTGFEFSVSAYPVTNQSLTWETNFNASFVKNEIIDLAGNDLILDASYSSYGGSMQILKPGYPYGSFYLYKWRGFDDAGANLFERQDGTLTTSPTADDQFIMGQCSPKWTLGWNNVVNWKNWTFNIFFNSALGFQRLNLAKYSTASMTGPFRFITLSDAYFKGWDNVSDKSTAEYPSLKNPDNKTYGNSDFWLEDASFVKLKNVSVTYTLPRNKLKNLMDLQLTLSAQNLFTITKYTGQDPEVYNEYNGLDFGAYPVPRTFTLGVKLIF